MTIEEIRKQGIHKREQRANLAIGIIWIGHTLDPNYLPHKQIIDKLVDYEHSVHESEATSMESSDASSFCPWFELNHLGEPICLNEYACRIAEGESTHVM